MAPQLWLRGRRTRLAALGTAVIVLGGVACSAVTALNKSQPSSAVAVPTTAPSGIVRSVAPAGVPQAVPAPMGASPAASAPQAQAAAKPQAADGRSEEHTSELQSQSNLVCR